MAKQVSLDSLNKVNFAKQVPLKVEAREESEDEVLQAKSVAKAPRGTTAPNGAPKVPPTNGALKKQPTIDQPVRPPPKEVPPPVERKKTLQKAPTISRQTAEMKSGFLTGGGKESLDGRLGSLAFSRISDFGKK